MAAKENQDIEIYAGDKISIGFPIEDQSGGPLSLVAPTGTWSFAHDVDGQVLISPLLTKTVRWETEVSGVDSWLVAYVDLVEADTLTKPGVYIHQLRIGPDKQVAASGVIRINTLIN
jgi:hypothetical protein